LLQRHQLLLLHLGACRNNSRLLLIMLQWPIFNLLLLLLWLSASSCCIGSMRCHHPRQYRHQTRRSLLL
jgi:membrane protein required for beta-lactamase induction